LDLLFHLLLPFLLLLLFGIRLEKKQYLILAFFSILPDFDRFGFGTRRGFHSFFFIAIVLLALFLLSQKKSHGKILLGLAAFGMLSHILLDFGGPIALFFPFDSTLYQTTLKLMIVNFFPVLSFYTEAVASIPQGYGIVVSEQGFAILLLLAVLWIFKKPKSIFKKN